MSFEPVFHLDEEMSNADSLPSVDEETEAFLEQAAEIARDVKHFYPVPYIPQLRYFTPPLRESTNVRQLAKNNIGAFFCRPVREVQCNNKSVHE